MIAIWGIEGGVAKAKLANIPIIQIVADIFNVLFVLNKIVLATVATSVAVTMFEERFVWSAAQKANIISKKISGKEFKAGPKVVCK